MTQIPNLDGFVFTSDATRDSYLASLRQQEVDIAAMFAPDDDDAHTAYHALIHALEGAHIIEANSDHVAHDA